MSAAHIQTLRDIYLAAQQDLKLVKSGRAPDWTEERVRRALFQEPWLTEHFQPSSGKELNAWFPDHTADVTWEEQHARLEISIPYLYNMACAARTRAMSYRNFNVGSAGLFFRQGFSKSNSWGVFSGMNTKHARNMRPICSEPITINGAHSQGFEVMIGIVVVGVLREEDIGILQTLHPCQDCRWLMNGHPACNDQSIVVTAMPPEAGGLAKQEKHTLKSLLEWHRRNSGDEF